MKKIINIPLFEGNIEVYTDKEETISRAISLGIVKKINKQKELDNVGMTYGSVYYDVKKEIIIIVYLPEEYDDVTTSHEIIHVITALYKYYNLSAPKEGRDEIFARYHDYFMTQIKKKVYNC